MPDECDNQLQDPCETEIASPKNRLSLPTLTSAAIAFGGADWFDDLIAHNDRIDVAFQPVINEYNGIRRVQLQVVDWRPATAPAPAVTA